MSATTTETIAVELEPDEIKRLAANLLHEFHENELFEHYFQQYGGSSKYWPLFRAKELAKLAGCDMSDGWGDRLLEHWTPINDLYRLREALWGEGWQSEQYDWSKHEEEIPS